MFHIQNIDQIKTLDPKRVSVALKQLLTTRLKQLILANKHLPTPDQRLPPRGERMTIEDQLWLVENHDDLNTDYPELGNHGIFSDTFDEHRFGDDEFVSPIEFIAHHPAVKVCELTCQLNDEATVIIFIPHEFIEQKPCVQDFLLFLQQQQLQIAGEILC